MLEAPKNEPILAYRPGSPEHAELASALAGQRAQVVQIPVVAGGRRLSGDATAPVICPHDHAHVLAHVHQASSADVSAGIQAAVAAQREWSQWSFEDRAAVFLKAADLLAGPWRQKLNAATMLGQSKTAYQAEIDSACELIDFLRWNVAFARDLQRSQPVSAPGMRNTLEYRPLEGFVYAVTPFNFTAIGGNLACAPALMGNTVLWKPAASAALSNYFVFELLEAAGLPPGVINFVPGDSHTVSSVALGSEAFAGLHFTGSTAVFDALWRQTAERLPAYRSYPRLVGETGGKDFVLAHPSADVAALSTALLRGAFEYQGQKCSAASRAYVPASLWPALKARLVDELATVRMGDVQDFGNFVGAVIDRKAYDRIGGYLTQARHASEASIVAGGGANDRTGYFIEPTVIEVDDPNFVTMREEIFGPVLSVYVYPDAQWAEVLKLVDSTSPYALTGAVFAQERGALVEASAALRFAAGNFYLNDKPTGAVVGQQPFGGARRSGTNDKAGSALNLLRWVSPRTIKETYVPAHHYAYPHMD
ncbi:L-glutamate gamma-semialdehyde dehydrogenase [Paraburkholderia sp. MMS20-SJTR3]|uniref:L-glutamate gamma-semialdehyde dehydrogenase n=1 Tax=Paraburkholderia sejongensis TaxID=2886946 RepID=A0ABS8JV95_9BURK|nr:L-glutamate gamma-semialdehyde dehydrogenase [Paraburkholderia sp. MMS20-SJTR3]MCC8393820.1 L-glutamate gamma-semialdehyde dehydrogenase [Paraburkholderia sp. MMS20-SJTR3]